jgi:hypothetical protein
MLERSAFLFHRNESTFVRPILAHLEECSASEEVVVKGETCLASWRPKVLGQLKYPNLASERAEIIILDSLTLCSQSPIYRCRSLIERSDVEARSVIQVLRRTTAR